MRKFKLYRKWCAMVAIFALSFTSAFTPCEAEAAEPPYLRAATYVSDAWVSNFWNTESDHMDAELAQIAADGFNSIVLVIPWREFQPSTMPVSYNDYAFNKLDKVMRAAKAQGLGVTLRVGYTWDYYADRVSTLRFAELLKDDSCRRAWIAYAEKLYQAASAHSNFYGGFITWEDFWNYVEDAGNFGTGANSRKEAAAIGFQDYLKERYTLKQLNEYYCPAEPFDDYGDIYIPGRNHYAYKLFYEFYDDFLMQLLKETQAVFPNLSMEVRLDDDPVEGPGGNGRTSVPHNQTFGCGDSGHTALMYSVSMGYGFHEVISASQAIRTMNEKLAGVRANNGGKPVFIDQLLYMDATKGFESNARLAEDQRVPFLRGITDTLRTHTNGYAVWSYRNYTNNPVYNSQFALGKRGWDVKGGAVEERGGSLQMKLRAGERLSQKVGHRISGRSSSDAHVRFTADSDRPVNVTVTLGGNAQTVHVDGPRQFDLNMGSDGFYFVSFAADGEVYLDNIHVYNFIQDGQLRDIDGKELSCMDAMRTLNASMR